MTGLRLPRWAAVAVAVAAVSNTRGKALLSRKQDPITAGAPETSQASAALEQSLDPRVQAELIQRVAAEQNRLFEVIISDSRDLNQTGERVQSDLASARKAIQGLMEVKNRTIDANATALRNKELTKKLNGSFDQLILDGDATSENISMLNKSVEPTHERLGGIAKMISAGKRVADGQQAFNLLKPRLVAVGKSLETMEAKLHFGNLTSLADDKVNEETMNIMEDMGRGMAANLPDPNAPKPRGPAPGPAPGPSPSLTLVSHKKDIVSHKKDIDDTTEDDHEYDAATHGDSDDTVSDDTTSDGSGGTEETITVQDDMDGEESGTDVADGDEYEHMSEQERTEREVHEDPEAFNGEYDEHGRTRQEDPEANSDNYDSEGRSMEEQMADEGDYSNTAESYTAHEDYDE